MKSATSQDSRPSLCQLTSYQDTKLPIGSAYFALLRVGRQYTLSFVIFVDRAVDRDQRIHRSHGVKKGVRHFWSTRTCILV